MENREEPSKHHQAFYVIIYTRECVHMRAYRNMGYALSDIIKVHCGSGVQHIVWRDFCSLG